MFSSTAATSNISPNTSNTINSKQQEQQQNEVFVDSMYMNMEGIRDKDIEEYKHILNILLAAGYFRVRIASLTPFDKILGGLCWSISNIDITDIELEILSFEEEANIGKKIKLSEKVILALKRMDCPHKIQSFQIQGLDCPNLNLVIQWLINKVFESRFENKNRIIKFSELQFKKRFELPQEEEETKNYYSNQLPYIESMKDIYSPKRKFKYKNRNEYLNVQKWQHVQSILLEYGVEFKQTERTKEEKEEKLKLERQLKAQEQKEKIQKILRI